MLDYNHRKTLAEAITDHIDAGLQQQRAKQKARHYLGASSLGVACDRALQYDYVKAPVDPGRELSGKALRIFEAGYVFEQLMTTWLNLAGFAIETEMDSGDQFGFSAAGGRIQGHVDGIIVGGPIDVPLQYPVLWECKSLNNRSWKETAKKGLLLSKPTYAAQIALYQAYMEVQVPGISQNPALFTAINKDTGEIYIEAVPFNGQLAQRSSDRAVNILRACDAHELLPRMTKDPAHFECKCCPWRQRCWRAMTV